MGAMDAVLKLLVVEDNPDLAANLIDYFEARGHVVDSAGDGLLALRLASGQDFDLILLDLVLPGIDGVTLCRRLREEAGKRTPVLILTARDGLDDKIAGLEAGADDYVVKPFALREVEARVRALVRRASAQAGSPLLQCGDLRLDCATCSVSRAGRNIELPPIPLRLLETLLRAAPRVLAREELERAVWGDSPPDSDALRAHMHVLRTAVDKPFDRPLIRTLRGLGWQISSADAPA